MIKKIILVLFVTFFNFNSFATPTKIMVRAKAKDAKFIGNSIGGAYIIIRNQRTGEILSQGKTKGGTGDTSLIMKTPRERNINITDDKTSGFLAELDISEPVFVSIEVFAPINKKQATVSGSTTLWIIPGKDILGDGIIIEIPGFVIDILTPRTHQFISLKSIEEKSISIQSNIVMMCGCAISDGGLWDANQIEVKGILKKDGTKIQEIPLKVSSPNLFEGSINVDSTGNYELIVYAYHPKTGNTGVDKVNYIITP
ncbi:hypothetical protein [Aquimarina algiphila]|uniref:hypothetical protein n=1 Tax=Aquimarina algiphila TaxID=2047982 RepID=UPI002492FD11|nr:hypothetical protein [Aquimarina algiphila]